MKVRCDITGIDCPNCAAKLESLMKKDDLFKNVSLNFSLSSLVLEVEDDADEEQVAERAQSIADRFEECIRVELRD
ncbi:MAG: hypothetical protein J6M93_06270 [Succinivibrio sp.]|nr:hypothetical protein [Succinivibrio sp.]